MRITNIPIMKLHFIPLIAAAILTACNTPQQVQRTPIVANTNSVLPKAIVYKTTRDYSNAVPVQMNDERTEIISFPAPSDIYYNGNLAKPTALSNGYYLDNRGINANTVFTTYTYEEYSKLKEIPSLITLKSKITELHPITEIYECNARAEYKNEVKELNQLIQNGFKNTTKIKLKQTTSFYTNE